MFLTEVVVLIRILAYFVHSHFLPGFASRPVYISLCGTLVFSVSVNEIKRTKADTGLSPPYNTRKVLENLELVILFSVYSL